MKPRDLAAGLRKRGWLIIAIVAVAALISSIVARLQTPTYKVEITVSAIAPINPTTKQPDSTTAAVLIATFPSIISAVEGVDVARAVSESLAAKGIDLSVEELLEKVNAEAELQTSYGRVSISDSSPTRAAEIANTWGEVLELKTSDDVEVNDPALKSLLLGGKLDVTSQAVPPKSPAKPKPLVYLGLGVFVGLVLGFGLVIGIEYFDPHFRSPQEVEEMLGIPVLGTIARLKGTDMTTLISSRSGVTPIHEAYSQLRTMLVFTLADKPFVSLAVTPTIPSEGNAYISANLGASMALTERETLLIDCDLAEKSLSRLYGAENRPGLADSLSGGEASPEKVLEKTVGTGVPNLRLLPAGNATGHPSDLLSLPTFERLLGALRGEFDKIILNTPSLVTSVDGAIAASKADISLVVIDVQRCTRTLAVSAMETFNLLNIVPTGAVLSNVKISRAERALFAQKASSRATEPAAKSRRTREKAGEAVAAAVPGGSRADKRAKKKEPASTAAGRGRPEPATPQTAAPRPERAGTAAEERRERRWPSLGSRRERPEPERPRAAAVREAEKAEPPTALEGLRPFAVAEGTAETRAAGEETPAAGRGEEGVPPELAQVADEFSRLGARGEPLPRQWLRALNSDKEDVRESATVAVSAYYRSYLMRYQIGEENAERISGSIVKMIRREGEFSSMSKEEAQKHLQRMLAEAGARFAAGPGGVPGPAAGGGLLDKEPPGGAAEGAPRESGRGGETAAGGEPEEEIYWE